MLLIILKLNKIKAKIMQIGTSIQCTATVNSIKPMDVVQLTFQVTTLWWGILSLITVSISIFTTSQSRIQKSSITTSQLFSSVEMDIIHLPSISQMIINLFTLMPLIKNTNFTTLTISGLSMITLIYPKSITIQEAVYI